MATPNDTTPTKVCTKCARELPATLEYFHKRSQTPSGIKSRCKDCCKQDYDPARRSRNAKEYYEINKETIKQKTSLYYHQHKELAQEQHRAYYASHKEAVQQKQKEWSKNNRAVCNANQRKYHHANKDKHRIKQMHRRAMKRNATGSYSLQDIDIIHKAQKGLCWWCGVELQDMYHIDHRIPLSKGGTNYPENLCLSCPECNCSKSNKMPWEWCGRLL